MFFKKKPTKLDVEKLICKTINETLHLKNSLCAFDYVTGVTELAELLGIFDIEDSAKHLKAAEAVDVEVSKKKKAQKEEMKAIAKAHKEKQKKESKS